MLVGLWIAIAYSFGLMMRVIGLPPLLGYLAAGFILHSLNPILQLPAEGEVWLHELSHLGVLLLMFTVGLKLRPATIVRPEVLGGGLLHFGISVLIMAPSIYWIFSLSLQTSILLACALSFSSTVLAAKVLEDKRELRAFHGRVAIGILVLQDIIALAIMSLADDHSPSPWALCILALPLLRPLLYKLLDSSGHDELLVLLGLLLAVAAGGYGFEAVGLSSELGALVFGALLAQHKRAVELAHSLWGIKEIFLVGFFLQIGSNGLPDQQALIFALAMVLILPLKMLFFFALLIAFKLRARSAFLTGLSLGQYSEFGLIMASVLMPEWLVPLAITLALSFVVSAPLNRIAHPLYERLANYLLPFERNIRHPDQQPVSLGDAEVLIIGMGRTGTAAYDYLSTENLKLIALDSDPAKVELHTKENRHIVFADAEDIVFWQDLDLSYLKSVILSTSDLECKIIAARKLRKYGFTGLVLSHSLYPDEATIINNAGADKTYLTMSQAGEALAEHLLEEQKLRGG
jgi:predicted Kef-type K+ transport protein